MTAVLVLFSAFYSFLLLVAAGIWRSLVNERPFSSLEGSENFFSVVVPVRNESANIQKLLLSLSSQTYSSKRFEVLVIDDHSEDDTCKIVEDLSKDLSYKIRLYSLKELNEKKGKKLFGKKQALRWGIENAGGNIIVTTDGDCIVSAGWLESISLYFKQPIKMLLGPVSYYGQSSWFEHFQTLELAALIGVGAVSLKSGSPNMCNGANLAFTREVFYEVGGYKGNLDVASGDDEFLLHKVHTLYPGEVRFNTYKEGMVLTKAAADLGTFVNQRKRWAGKWKIHKSLGVKLLAIFVFSFHLTFCLGIIGMLSGLLSFSIIAGLLLLKALSEFVFIGAVLSHFEKKLSLKHFVVLQGIYSFYVIVFGLIANFGSFDWKGRKY